MLSRHCAPGGLCSAPDQRSPGERGHRRCQLRQLPFQCTQKLALTRTTMKILAAIPMGIALLAVALSAPAEEDVKAAPITQLSKIELYAFGGIGFAGTISQGETLYQAILKRPTATADFVKIAEKGTPEAKMYALHALARLSPDQYRELKKSAKRDQKVTTMQGCLVSDQTVGDVLDGIEEQLRLQKGTE